MNTLTEKERQAVVEFSKNQGEPEKWGILKGAEFLAQLRNDENSIEDLWTTIKEAAKQHATIRQTYGYERGFIDGCEYGVLNLIPKQDVNAELLEALNDLYQSLPDGYTDECLVKVKKQLLPYWNERSKLLSQQLEDEEF